MSSEGPICISLADSTERIVTVVQMTSESPICTSLTY